MFDLNAGKINYCYKWRFDALKILFDSLNIQKER